ncbi:hypothetical protein NDU88_001630 [Pleurodeles waltl]|uniref:Uncharacterized protein n=1 Tax=Pleurodeles waltl TaxID=8319 RepID=A0AAV7T031_PLEWA|nr:hypothetical protein NDU88_001630 [Pleurodeles waltl]
MPRDVVSLQALELMCRLPPLLDHLGIADYHTRPCSGLPPRCARDTYGKGVQASGWTRQLLSAADQVTERFRIYYSDLYKTRLAVDDEAVIYHLMPTVIKWLSAEHRGHLTAPFCTAELRAALKGMSSGKASGTNGLPVVFYKAYQDQLILHLVTLYDEMAKEGCMPHYM